MVNVVPWKIGKQKIPIETDLYAQIVQYIIQVDKYRIGLTNFWYTGYCIESTNIK